MVEHQKNILLGVSSNKVLFRMELVKSLTTLNEIERKKIIRWVKDNFAATHSDVIMDVFYPDYDYST